MAEYIYSVSRDTKVGACIPGKLWLEIERGVPDVTLINVDVTGDVLTVSVDGELDAGDQQLLSDVISAHIGLDTSARWQPRSSVAVQTDTTGTLGDALDWTGDPLEPGLYRFSFSLELRVQTGGSDAARASILIDGVAKHDLWSLPVNSWQTFSGWHFARYDSGEAPRVQVQFSRTPSITPTPDTAEIKNIYVSWERMDK